MCMVSYVGDNWNKEFVPQDWVQRTVTNFPEVSREEFEKLKTEVEALKKLLKAAKIYDEETGQKDCEMEDKVAIIKKIADIVGIDMKDVFDK